MFLHKYKVVIYIRNSKTRTREMTAKTGRSTVGGWNSLVFRSYVVQTRWLAILTDVPHEKLKRMAYKTIQIQLPSTTLQLTVL